MRDSAGKDTPGCSRAPGHTKIRDREKYESEILRGDEEIMICEIAVESSVTVENIIGKEILESDINDEPSTHYGGIRAILCDAFIGIGVD